MAERPITDTDVLAQIPAARRRAQRALTNQPHVASASYDAPSRLLQVTLTNGAMVVLPVDLIGSLRVASDQDLAQVTVGVAGVGLRWSRLDEDLSIAGLLHLAFGSRNLLRASGAAGGAARSPAKIAAARSNGAKGGRPRKRRVMGTDQR